MNDYQSKEYIKKDETLQKYKTKLAMVPDKPYRAEPGFCLQCCCTVLFSSTD
jgi:hypothetical protein